VFDLNGEDESEDFNWIGPSVDIIPQKQVLCCLYSSSHLLEQSNKVVVLTMNIADYGYRILNLDYVRLWFCNLDWYVRNIFLALWTSSKNSNLVNFPSRFKNFCNILWSGSPPLNSCYLVRERWYGMGMVVTNRVFPGSFNSIVFCILVFIIRKQLILACTVLLNYLALFSWWLYFIFNRKVSRYIRSTWSL